jgi:hypothetical protein
MIMKTTTWSGLVVSALLAFCGGCASEHPAPPAAAPTRISSVEPVTGLSPAATEAVTMAMAGNTEENLLAYAQTSPREFALSSEQVLYLRDVGLSSRVISAMLERDAVLRTQPRPTYTYNQQAYPATVPPPSEPGAAMAPVSETPAQETTVQEPTVQATVAQPVMERAATPPVYVTSPPAEVASFYSSLSPYGTWVNLPEQGWCWQPTVVVVNPQWRPYCDNGHWLWTDAGWYWASDYSWGWAPFHYGRWHMHARHGWVWVPDRTWGPAWVVWRQTDNYCGWAPLPPHAEFDMHLGWVFNGVHVGLNFDFGLYSHHYTFIPMERFCDRDLGHRRLPPGEVSRFYTHTTVINNYTVNNTVVVNHGLQVERVAAATHTEFHPASVRDLPPGTRPGRVAQGSESVVYRPQLQTPPSTTRNMLAQKIDARHPAIQHSPARVEVQSVPAQKAALLPPTLKEATPSRPKPAAVPGELRTPPTSVPALRPKPAAAPAAPAVTRPPTPPTSTPATPAVMPPATRPHKVSANTPAVTKPASSQTAPVPSPKPAPTAAPTKPAAVTSGNIEKGSKAVAPARVPARDAATPPFGRGARTEPVAPAESPAAIHSGKGESPAKASRSVTVGVPEPAKSSAKSDKSKDSTSVGDTRAQKGGGKP